MNFSEMKDYLNSKGKNFGSSLSSKEQERLIRTRKELLLQGSDTLSPRNARDIAEIELRGEGKIPRKKPSSLDFLPSDWL